MNDPITHSLQAAAYYRWERADECDPAVYNELMDSFVGGSYDAMVQKLAARKAGTVGYNKARKRQRSLYVLAAKRDLLHPKLCETCGGTYYPVQGNTKYQRFCSQRCAHTLPGNKCNRGHEFTPENTRLYGKDKTYRSCRACEKHRKLKAKESA